MISSGASQTKPSLRSAKDIPVSSALNGLLVCVVLFPFVPAIIRSSDTQPTFTFVFCIALLTSFALPAVGSRLFHISYWGVTATVTLVFLLYFLLLLANLVDARASIPSRLFSFCQFCAAVVWAYSGKHEWTTKSLYRAMQIYLVFTFVYFLTNGLVENVLIHSRAALSASLFESGRGARTLAPEPSFFAMQVFNIYLLYRLIERRGVLRTNRLPFLALVSFCLVSSLSVYGAIALLLILAVEFPKLFAFATLFLVSATSVAQGVLQHWGSVRAVSFILALVSSHGGIAKIFLLDASLASRVSSFLAYLSSFAAHPWTGNGFSLLQGGGFISIVTAFGLVGLLFFSWAFLKILTAPYSRGTTVLLTVWFVMNFISGPIGIPIIGVIFGTVLSRSSVLFESRPDRAQRWQSLATT